MKTRALQCIGCICFLLFLAGCAHESKPAGSPPAPAPPPPEISVPVLHVSDRVNHWTRDWTPIFDGQSLSNWAITDFAGHGEVTVTGRQVNIGMGAELSGVNWTNGTLPKTDYEISLQAKKVDGGDFFCGLTFPVGESFCSLIMGGWGGGVVGLSSLDGNDASENETTKTMAFPAGQWYDVRVRVTPARIEAWINQEKMIDATITGRKVALRPGPIVMCVPLGVATYETSAAVRDVKLRLIKH